MCSSTYVCVYVSVSVFVLYVFVCVCVFVGHRLANKVFLGTLPAT